ncbi:hypothetical protein CTA2_12672 [Colletotrichum tanaceti]|nr:hypothetical protein CTA2_12672 [Colletotrichum tanaceti]
MLLSYILFSPTVASSPVPEKYEWTAGLRGRGDTDYTVGAWGIYRDVYTPYYKHPRHRPPRNKYSPQFDDPAYSPVTRLKLSVEESKEIIITEAWNKDEARHDDGSERLPLSEIIKFVADEHSRSPLEEATMLTAERVYRDETVEFLRTYFGHRDPKEFDFSDVTIHEGEDEFEGDEGQPPFRPPPPAPSTSNHWVSRWWEWMRPPTPAPSTSNRGWWEWMNWNKRQGGAGTSRGLTAEEV